jgi:hypothetical protein
VPEWLTYVTIYAVLMVPLTVALEVIMGRQLVYLAVAIGAFVAMGLTQVAVRRLGGRPKR